jgi:hypothetical protein
MSLILTLTKFWQISQTVIIVHANLINLARLNN